ncbi:hypothetical protein AB6834_02630 [Carnobacterium divergens]|uniref:hypothetical protein n=1 Tax=Carnobacterium divergens TaxID=2748 RepID=UPI0039BE6C41
MDNMITTIISTVAVCTSIASIIMVFIQGKKNRRLKSLTEFKIKCLNNVISNVTEYCDLSHESLILNVKIKRNNSSEDDKMRDLEVSQRLLLIKYELNIWMNYDNEKIYKVSDELENFATKREDLNENSSQEIDYSLSNEAGPLISALKNYIQEEWKLINKEL